MSFHAIARIIRPSDLPTAASPAAPPATLASSSAPPEPPRGVIHLCDVLRQELGRVVPAALEADGRSDKELADAVGMTPRAICNLRLGLNLPNGVHLLALSTELAPIGAVVRRHLELDAARRLIEAMERDHDPEAGALLARVADALRRRA